MAKRGPKPKKTEYYIDPAEFKQQLVGYYTNNINYFTGSGRTRNCRSRLAGKARCHCRDY